VEEKEEKETKKENGDGENPPDISDEEGDIFGKKFEIPAFLRNIK